METIGFLIMGAVIICIFAQNWFLYKAIKSLHERVFRLEDDFSVAMSRQREIVLEFSKSVQNIEKINSRRM